MTELYLMLDAALPEDVEPERLAGLAGLVVDGSRLSPEACRAWPAPIRAVMNGDDNWRAEPAIPHIVDDDLEACARLRTENPQCPWLPRLSLCKADPVYRMIDSPGEGFRFYTPDTSAIQAYHVVSTGKTLRDELALARSLGLERIWLHAVDAARHGQGLDLDMLEQAKQDFDGEIWISGGASQPRHLESLAREGGAGAVVIDLALLHQSGSEFLTRALHHRPPPEIPVQQPCPGASG